jgi:asparagine synthase (glutamine-hydrolysing)
MCGIAGSAGMRGAASAESVIGARDAMRHRGPDDAGLWRADDGTVVFGHRRLSIVDLSPTGHQPMHDPLTGCVIVFNGEIYNFQALRAELAGRGATFRGTSDTEVLLAAYREWGIEFLQRIAGMFAFVLFDPRSRRLIGARDRAGEKPFFYRLLDGHFDFASELKGLLAMRAGSPTIDPAALNEYFAYGYVPGAACMVRGVAKLPAGHAFTFDLSNQELHTWAYWTLPAPARAGAAPADELIDRLDALLEDAVRRQIVADVPVGVLLSGGVDSSLVTAMAARVSSAPVRTFTISFPGHAQHDEAAFARIVASHFGTAHTDLPAEAATVDLLPELARQYDEPLADSSMVPTFLVSRLIRQHATVALGGDGGDELFGGYHSHSWLLRQQRARRAVPSSARRLVRAATEQLVPVGVKGRNYVLGYMEDTDESLARPGIFFEHAARKRVLRPIADRISNDPERRRMQAFNDGRHLVERVTAMDFSLYMPDDILVKVDRASMLTSLEVRAPFLDQSVIEFAFGAVPPEWRATTRERKRLPRALGARILPKALDLRRKQGFSIPLQSWFKGPWGDYMEEVVRSADPALFDRTELGGVIDAQRRGLANTHRIFAVTMFELWRREYGATLG